MVKSKIMSAKEAVERYVKDGDVLTIGGFVTNRKPYGLVSEIIRQKKKNLILESGPGGGDVDMLIGAGCVEILINSYVANSKFTNVGRRFKEAIRNGDILFEDYSLDIQSLIYHAAALGQDFIAVKNMLGSDLVDKWGISEEVRKKYKKLPNKKFIIGDNPFKENDKLCYVPVPEIDVAIIHAHKASGDGTCRIIGPEFQDIDIAVAAKHTIVTCEELVSDEEIRNNPELNSIPGICVDAVVEMKYGAHPSQMYGAYDYDAKLYWEYEDASKTQEGFEKYLEKYVYGKEHAKYLEIIGEEQIREISDDTVEIGYVVGLDRGRQ